MTNPTRDPLSHPARRGALPVLGLLLLSLSIAACAAAGWYQWRSRQQAQQVEQNWLPSVQAIGQIQNAMYQLRRVEVRALLNQRNCIDGSCSALLIKNRQDLLALESQYEPMVSSLEEELLFLGYKIAKQNYLMMQDSMPFAANAQVATSRFLNGSQGLFDDVSGALEQLSAVNVRAGAVATKAADRDQDTALALMALAVALQLGLALALWLDRRAQTGPKP